MKLNLNEKIDNMKREINNFKDKHPFTYGCIIGAVIGVIICETAKNTGVLDDLLEDKFND